MILTPPHVRRAVDALENAGRSAYLVGGCVRDAVMGLPPHDFDLATDATPEEMKRVFAGQKLILAGEKHGTVAVVLDGEVVEITTFRVDGPYADGRHPEGVMFTRALLSDLSRRDFTINAMAYSEREGLIDPFGGRADCAEGIIRCVGEPERRLTEDALRILRGLRFASRLGFAIEKETTDALNGLCPRLTLVSRERVAAELTGILTGKYADQVLRAFPKVLFAAVPELKPLYDCPQQSVYHFCGAWEHTLHTLAAVTPRTPRLTFAALLHDCGKPAARTRDEEGRDHFPNHGQLGEKLAEQVLKSLKMPTKFTREVCALVLHHDDYLTLKSVRPMLHAIGDELFDDLVALKRADISAHAPCALTRADGLDEVLAERRRVIENGLCYSLGALKARGDDLKKLGFSGRAVSETLDGLLALVMTDRLPNEREALIKQAKEML